MKLLFDANISRRILPTLADLFPESAHITLLGFSGETLDKTIWEFARQERFAIVTAAFSNRHSTDQLSMPT